MSSFLEKYIEFSNRGNNIKDYSSKAKDKLLFSVFQGNTRSLNTIITKGFDHVKDNDVNAKEFNDVVVSAGYFSETKNEEARKSVTDKGKCIKNLVKPYEETIQKLENEKKTNNEEYRKANDHIFCITLLSFLDGKFKNSFEKPEENCFVRNVLKLIGLYHNLGYTTNNIITLCESILRDYKASKEITPWGYKIFWFITFYNAPDFLRDINVNFDSLDEVVQYINKNKADKNYIDIVSSRYSKSRYQTSTFIEEVEIVYSLLNLILNISKIDNPTELWDILIDSVSYSRIIDKTAILKDINVDNNKKIFIDIFNNVKSDILISSISAIQSSYKRLNFNKDMSNPQHYLSYLTAIRTKPFLLLAGISGTGKSRIVRKLAQATVTEELQKKYDKEYKGTDFKNDRWNLHAPANFELIQVKPNWHNSMDVVGYLSNIPSPHYVFTPFVEFVARAWQHPEIPFFLCLDEMNLAPVEEYFAEFLSAIESRSFENDEYLTDPIIKPFCEFKEVQGEDGKTISIENQMLNDLLPKVDPSETEEAKVITHVSEHFKNKGLTLPKNLIVIGTVNMDETTFSFSRKVLDRAMSIEMNEVKYDMFLADTTDDGLKQIVKDFEENKYGEGITLNSYLVDRHIEAKEIFANGDEDAIFVINFLTRINNLLEGTPFKLGYRAANEALIYVKSAEEFKNGGIKSALDSFTLMKILSRMEGDESKLAVLEDEPRLKDAKLSADKVKEDGKITLLTCLRQIIKEELPFDIEKEVPVTPEDNNDETEQESLVNEEETTMAENKVDKTKVPVEPQSVKKLNNMIAQLRRDHFVSYWN